MAPLSFVNYIRYSIKWKNDYKLWIQNNLKISVRDLCKILRKCFRGDRKKKCGHLALPAIRLMINKDLLYEPISRISFVII
jgi:hypothetical protein